MIYLRVPILEDFKKSDTSLKLNNFRIYSSIFKPTPKASFSLVTTYATPELYNFFIGSSFPLQYQFTNFEKQKEMKEKGQSDKPEFTDLKNLTGMSISNISVEASGSALQYEITCTGEFDFFQKSRIRKSYKNKFGNEIIQDVLDSNDIMKDYVRNIDKTDNAVTIYRTLGEADLDFIEDTINSNFTINFSKPLIFTGLDRSINYTSVNSLISRVVKTKLLLTWPSITQDKLAEKHLETLKKSYVEEDSFVELKTASCSLNIGGAAYNNIKNIAYYTDFSNGILDTAGYVHRPALKDKAYFPIDKGFINFIDSTQAIPVYNRPSSNISYETKRYFDGYENLITIKASVSDIGNLNHLVLAGDQVTVLTPYPYSVYNGNYVIAEIEYGQDQASPFMSLTLIRSNLDLKWVEKLQDNKDSEKFKLPFAPNFQKNLVYTI